MQGRENDRIHNQVSRRIYNTAPDLGGLCLPPPRNNHLLQREPTAYLLPTPGLDSLWPPIQAAPLRDLRREITIMADKILSSTTILIC